MTPVIKCLLLLSLTFSAEVISSQSGTSHGSKRIIQHGKYPHFVRTFIKYHHRRENNNNELQHWPFAEQNNKIRPKRSVQYFKLDSIVKFGDVDGINKIEKVEKSNFDDELKKYKVKAAVVFKEPPTTKSPLGIKCLYKIHQMTLSATASENNYNPDETVQSENFVPGVVSQTTLPNGETVQVEQCTHPRASCYTLWYDGDGNTTVLGQGCWHSSRDQDKTSCDKCTRVTPKLPATKFCCCTTEYCNGDFLSIREELVTQKAESKQELPPDHRYGNLVGATVVACIGVLVVCVAAHMIYCTPKPEVADHSDGLEKGETGKRSDAMATGLLCVDNLTLHEHIGRGKFGSVWSGSLGSRPVAVKMYCLEAAWRKERGIYATPGIDHPNILKYYGAESRPLVTVPSDREHLLLLELAAGTLRGLLTAKTLTWREFQGFSRGLAAAVAHLHTPKGEKPCIVHRDITSTNVLISGDTVKLADLGLAQALYAQTDSSVITPITEAGTTRYLSPEALEGALDLTAARGALCAVDVYALGLVLWEMLSRCVDAHIGPVAEYKPPFGDVEPTLNNMQNLVSRNKVRPLLPVGPDSRPLRIASNTCEECWDHDAEARLSAICVEERMAELLHVIDTPGLIIHHNIHSNHGDSTQGQHTEIDKNSNCVLESCTPLVPTHITGRNVCIQRNTHTDIPTDNVLIHKSLKDITTPTEPVGQRIDNQEQVLSVARVSQARVINANTNSLRSVQRPIAYVPNDVTQNIKETNLRAENPKWSIKKLFERKTLKPKETQVVLQDSVVQTSIFDKNCRPTNLILNDDVVFNMEGPCLSPPNRTLSPTMFSEITSEKTFGYKELPNDNENKSKQIFAVIVPKGIPTQSTSNSDSIKKYKSNSDSGDSIKKRFSDKIITNSSNSGRSSRATINLELQYLDSQNSYNDYDLNSECSSLEDEHLMLLSEDGGSKITMQITKEKTDILKECPNDVPYYNLNNYKNYGNNTSDGHNKENYIDNPVYLAFNDKEQAIKRQRSLEQVSEIFSSSSDVRLQNPANRVKTPGDLPVAIRKARRDKFRKSNKCNRLSLYDDRIMSGNSL